MISNLLDRLNAGIQQELSRKIPMLEKKRELAGYGDFSAYFLNNLREKIISMNAGLPSIEYLEVEFIDRESFGGDVAVKISKLLKEKGSNFYIKDIVPQLVENIRKHSGPDKDLTHVEHKGIYVNILLDNRYLFENVWQAVKMGGSFGRSDVYKKKSVVVDYSSPNVAKHLHAGHIRSTIIGEVLCNLYDAVGWTVHRLNYINDWGGMGFLMEGYERWIDKIPKEKDGSPKSDNDLLYDIYQIYRRGEKIAGDELQFNLLTPTAADELAEYYGIFGSFIEFKDKFEDFKRSADQRFKNLEKGEEIEFSLWQKMREWSLEDFDKFYETIGIRHDYLLGESFYAKRALEMVEDKLSTGEIVLFTRDLADNELAHLTNRLTQGELTKEIYDRLVDGVENDVGAYAVILANHRRLLVKRSDGGTLYAVRDLAGIDHRIETFNPDRLVYEVGEEQTEYFKTLFEAARVVNLDRSGQVSLSHIAHGFYVDADTGKKLSSREGVESVETLIRESIKYFRTKYDSRDGATYELSDNEKDENAKMLAVGSIVFNDIKQDKRFAVALDKDLSKAIKGFEESGGAYLMYSLARAGSILRKSDVSPEDAMVGSEDFKDFTEDEVAICKIVGQFPDVLLRSARDDNPATLASYLLTLANGYNSYYEKSKVLEGGRLLYPHRLLITKAVSVVLSAGLKLCHAEAPEVI